MRQSEDEGNIEEQKMEGIDKWFRELNLDDHAVHNAVQQGVRTTGLTQQYFAETSGESSAARPSPAGVRSGNEDSHPRPTFGDINRARQQRAPPHQQRANQQLPARPLEGPADDLRASNEGDRLARGNEHNPTDCYLFPTKGRGNDGSNNNMNYNDADRGGRTSKRRGDRGVRHESGWDVESRIIGVDRHHIIAIADLTGTHIKFPGDEPQDWANAEKTSYMNRVRIWGTREAVELAKAYLVYLNKHADRDAQSAAKKALAWPKVKAIPDKRHREAATREEKEKEEKSRFKKASDPNEQFPYTGVFAWPHAEVTPSMVLGPNFESLDPIRQDQGVYIEHSAKRNCFRVLGYNSESIQKALDRIYVVWCEIAARNRATYAITLAVPPKVFQPEVFFNTSHELTALPVTIRTDRDNTGAQIYLGNDGSGQGKYPGNWSARRDVLLLANESYIKTALDMALKDLVYLRLPAKLRVYFGTYVLYGYRRPKSVRHGLEEFMHMLRVAMASGEVFRQVGSREVGERLRNSCDIRTDLFHPAGPMEAVDAHGNPEPTYSCSMFIIIARKPDPPMEVKLEVEFERSPKTGQYHVGTRRWLKPSKISDGMSHAMKKRTLVDLKLLDLEVNVAYGIDCTIGVPLVDADKKPILNEFVLHFRLVDSKDGTTKRLSYITLPGINVVSIVTKKKYPYWFTGTPYIFEVTQHEHIRAIDQTARKPIDSGGFPTDFSGVSTTNIRWGACLYNTEWDAVLTRQASLPIGYAGEWKPNVDEFFSATGQGVDLSGGEKHKGKDKQEVDGFKGFMDMIQTCVDFITDVKDKVETETLAGEGESVELNAEQRRAEQEAARRGLQEPEDPVGTTGEEDDGYYPDDTLSTVDGGDRMEDGIEIEEQPEDDFAFLPVSGRGAPAAQRRAAKNNSARTVDTDSFSSHGDSEYSRASKARVGLGGGRGSGPLIDPSERGGVGSETMSKYGDSECSRTGKKKKKRTGLI
ncbi:hypothetical protein DRE_01337 [Drechslerella stenobrocha 248]|uniref:Uncharacterized protein n=1 Tax=Drechslerella stenobrocha 248 TaxID=1043628 RepID=W7I5I1_9PEZI|nr:hypothetical protein DRE_01337 [Drechslerella stenobrocha 248]